MRQTYQLSISGMTCHACESLIQMDLQEAGFPIQSINHSRGLLAMQAEEADLPRIQEIIESTQKYRVTNITPLA